MRPAPAGQGAVVEVRFADNVWYRGHLVKRIPGVDPPRWRVRFGTTPLASRGCLHPWAPGVTASLATGESECFTNVFSTNWLQVYRTGGENT